MKNIFFTLFTSFCICTLNASAQPANDNCSGAVPLTVNPILSYIASVPGTFAGATTSPDLPTPICYNGEKDVWYSFVATGHKNEISIINADGVTTLQVYSGDCGGLSFIPTSNCGAFSGTSRKVVGGLTAGNTYLIRVYSEWATNFSVCVSAVPAPPANDNVCGAINIAVSGGSCTGQLTNQTTLGATPSGEGCTGVDDDDIWYSFVATTTTHYFLFNNLSPAGPFGQTIYRVHQVFSSSDNTCGGTLTSLLCSISDLTELSGLTPGDTYFIRVHSQNLGYYSNFDLCIFSQGPPPSNDEASGAIDLAIGAGCTGNIYTTNGATASANEPYPSCSGTKQTPVWFSFLAPAGGAVKVSTDITLGTLRDSKLAIYSATNVNDYATFNVISCNDNGGSQIQPGKMSVTYAAGLTAGTRYYIAVDKSLASTINGPFCIAVDELTTSMLPVTNDCGTPVQIPVSNSNSTYTGWSPILDQSGKLVCLIKNSLGADVNLNRARVSVYTGGVRQSINTGVYYLNRSFRVDNILPANVDIQFFFLESEMSALTAADGTSLGSLAATRQPNFSCPNSFVNPTGVPPGDAMSVIPQNGSGNANGVSWVQFNTRGSEANFYLHKIGTVLPIVIEYFKGSRQDNGHLLEWKVSCDNSASLSMILERSSDGNIFTTIRSQNETSARCQQPFAFKDISPLPGINYYRLKTFGVDGRISYSSVVALMHTGKDFEIINIVPNPVKDKATFSVTSAAPTTIEIIVTDLSGRQIKKQRTSLKAGDNILSIQVENLASGTYQITGITSSGFTKTIRFVKH